MSRTTDECVRGIADVDPNILLGPFIDMASVFVSRMQSCASDRGYTYTEDELRVIETLLAAHLYSIRDPRVTSEGTERAQASYEVGKQGEGLRSTDYGKQAASLDGSGCLTAMSSGARAQFFWLGKAPSDQTDYIDRD